MSNFATKYINAFNDVTFVGIVYVAYFFILALVAFIDVVDSKLKAPMFYTELALGVVGMLLVGAFWLFWFFATKKQRTEGSVMTRYVLPIFMFFIALVYTILAVVRFVIKDEDVREKIGWSMFAIPTGFFFLGLITILIYLHRRKEKQFDAGGGATTFELSDVDLDNY